MSNTAKFKVTLEFEVDVNPISVPDVDTFSELSYPGVKKKEKPKLSEEELRVLMKKKGMSDADIDKYLAGEGKGGAAAKAKAKGKGTDYQLLLYPEYEEWVAAQRALQGEILKDDNLAARYVKEMVRDLIRGRLDAILDGKFGVPDPNKVLRQAIGRLPEAEGSALKVESDSLLFDETELVDCSVDCRFTGLTAAKA